MSRTQRPLRRSRLVSYIAPSFSLDAKANLHSREPAYFYAQHRASRRLRTNYEVPAQITSMPFPVRSLRNLRHSRRRFHLGTAPLSLIIWSLSADLGDFSNGQRFEDR